MAPTIETAPTTLSFAGAEVLLVENQAAVDEAMRALSRRWGCSTIVAANCAEAAAASRGGRLAPHLIVAEPHLAGGELGFDAIDAARGIRRRNASLSPRRRSLGRGERIRGFARSGSARQTREARRTPFADGPPVAPTRKTPTRGFRGFEDRLGFREDDAPPFDVHNEDPSTTGRKLIDAWQGRG